MKERERDQVEWMPGERGVREREGEIPAQNWSETIGQIGAKAQRLVEPREGETTSP